MKITKRMVIKEAAKQGLRLDPCLLKTYRKGTRFWAIHHTEITETLQHPLVDRLWCILTGKDSRERQTRLDAIRPLSSKALAECDKAQAECDKALAEYVRAWAECDKAWAEADKAQDECDKAQAECDKAQAEYRRKLLAIWDRDYPKHPAWNLPSGLVFN
jgi:hypothetical protein